MKAKSSIGLMWWARPDPFISTNIAPSDQDVKFCSECGYYLDAEMAQRTKKAVEQVLTAEKATARADQAEADIHQESEQAILQQRLSSGRPLSSRAPPVPTTAVAAEIERCAEKKGSAEPRRRQQARLGQSKPA